MGEREGEGEGVRTRDEEGKKKVSCERVMESVQERCEWESQKEIERWKVRK